MKGYIKLYRQIADNPIWRIKPFSEGQAWIDILCITNYEKGFIKTKNGEIITIQCGECGYSMLTLSERWGWSRGKVKRFLSLLEKQEMIQQKMYGKHTIISILNFNKYQNRATNDTTNDTINGQQTDTIKKNKEEKEIYKESKKKNISYPSLEEIKNYCQERNNGVDPQQFYDYYSVANWKDRDGKPVKNWKQKMIATWEKKQTRKPANSKDNVLRIADRLLNIESKKEESETAQKETQEVRTNEQRRIYKGISHPI